MKGKTWKNVQRPIHSLLEYVHIMVLYSANVAHLSGIVSTHIGSYIVLRLRKAVLKACKVAYCNRVGSVAKIDEYVVSRLIEIVLY